MATSEPIHSQRSCPTSGIKVVDTFSSYIGDSNETRSVTHAHHRDVARFASADDPGFKRIGNVLLRWKSDIPLKKAELRSYTFTAATRAAVVDQHMNYEIRQMCLTQLNNWEARYRIRDVKQTFEDTYIWLFKDKVGFEN